MSTTGRDEDGPSGAALVGVVELPPWFALFGVVVGTTVGTPVSDGITTDPEGTTEPEGRTPLGTPEMSVAVLVGG